MRRTLLSLTCAAVVLSALWAWSPVARADDTTDYINQIYQDQQSLNDYLDSIQQTQDYVDQIYQDQQALDDYLNSIQQTQDYVNQINQDQQPLQDYLNSIQPSASPG
jgi:hypothetical protein